jgi:tetratricopeptide (TPR) repeat protein
MFRRACALALLVLCSATPEAGQKTKPPEPPPPIAPLDLPRLLDLYAAGRFDEAVRSVAQVDDEIGQRLRRHWDVTGRQWIDADVEHRPQRILVTAAFMLETEHVRAERGEWRVAQGDPPCAAACALDWAQLQLVQRGAPDQAERAWYLAAAALAAGDRDWRYLQRPVRPPGRAPEVMPGLLDRALARFPGDSALRLEQAIAAAGRFNIVADGSRLAPTIPLPQTLVIGRGGISLQTLGLDPNAAHGMLTALVDEPLVGPEARLRLGYLYWALQRDDLARDELTRAAERTGDADVRYLAQFLLGWIAIKRGDAAGAIPRLEAALAARPASQSAALALASLELQRGDADKANAIAQASLDRRSDVDPWRLFLYGNHPRWPARLADLRRAVKP